MTPEEAVRARLLTMSPLTDVVSTRIYLNKLPQSPTYPCVKVMFVDEVGDDHLRGSDAMKTARVQVDACAREVSGVDPYALALRVADLIHGPDDGSGLSGWSGEIGGSPSSRVLGCQRDRRHHFYDPEELRVITMSQDYRVYFRA